MNGIEVTKLSDRNKVIINTDAISHIEAVEMTNVIRAQIYLRTVDKNGINIQFTTEEYYDKVSKLLDNPFEC